MGGDGREKQREEITKKTAGGSQEAAAKKKENLQTDLKYAKISTFFIVVSFTREMG